MFKVVDTRSELRAPRVVGLIAVAASVIVAALAGTHLPRFASLADTLRGCCSALNLVIAVLLYNRALVEPDADAARFGNLFLFAAGGIVAHSLEYAPPELLVGTTICPPEIVWHGLLLGLIVAQAIPVAPALPRWRIRYQIAATIGLVLLAVPLTLRLDALLRQPSWHPSAALGLLLLLSGFSLMVLRRWGVRAPTLWLALVLVAWLGMFGLRALGARLDSLGAVGGNAILLAVQLAAFAGLYRGLTDRLVSIRAANARLERLAHHDALTGLPNRRRFDERLFLEWRRCARAGARLSLVLIDVDLFKQFNDLYGHPMGDACLARLGALLRSQVDRPDALVARLGGEEFVLLLPGVDKAEASLLAERLRLALRGRAIRHEGSQGGVVTLSAGVACVYPSGPASGAFELVKAADKALYFAKQAGRDQVIASAAQDMSVV